MEGLLALRDYCTAKKTVTLKDDFLVFGDQTFPRKTKTPFRGKNKKLYELDAIWFYLYNYEQLGAGHYIKAAKEAGVDTIAFGDRKIMSEYMHSKTDTCVSIDTSLVMNEDEKIQEKTYDNDDISSINKDKRKSMDIIDMSQWTSKDIINNERPLFTRSSIMAGRCSFNNIMNMYDNVQKDHEREIRDNKKNKKSTTSSNKHKHSSLNKDITFKPRNATDVIPIIIVPSAISSMITLYNARDFLEKGGFVESEKIRQTSSGSKKPEYIEITRVSSKDNKRNVKYHIVDDVKSIKQWERVVAVFTTGAKWQFKDFPYSTPAEIFNKILGFHLHFQDEKPGANIAMWNCHPLKISKTTRYQDRGVVLSFWRQLVDWISVQPSKKLLEY